jgi:four helix bundle protein
MGVRRIEDLVAHQFAVEFRSAVNALLHASPRAERDFRFVSQLRDCAGRVAPNISEGFHRFGLAESAQFLRYALASLAEAQDWLDDGAERGYYADQSCEPARTWARRCKQATNAFRASQERLADERRRKRARPPITRAPKEPPPGGANPGKTGKPGETKKIKPTGRPDPKPSSDADLPDGV